MYTRTEKGIGFIMAGKVKDRIREVFLRYGAAESELDAVFSGEPILNVLSIDSLTMLYVVNDLERDFDVRFDYDTIERAFEDIHTLAAFLSEKAGRASRIAP